MKCIDVSNWQGVISTDVWKSMKTKIPYAIIRSSYTSNKDPFTLNKDKSFDQNIRNAHSAGIKVGVYHYSQATTINEAIAEAKYVIKLLTSYKKYITLPVVFDWEFGTRLNAKKAKAIGKSGCYDICDAFCKKVKQAGYEPMVYANLSTLNNYISNKLSKAWKVWVAQYSSTCDYKYPYFMWQYTSSARVSGIRGKVDMNYIYIKSKKESGKIPYPGVWPKLPERGWFQKGDKGAQVVNLQKLLNWILDEYDLATDGIFGDYTRGAVLKFQKKYKLSVDGGFGKQCMEKAKGIKK